MSRESFITANNCPVRWKRLAKWRETSQSMDQLSEERKATFKHINDLNFDEPYYATNNYVNSVALDKSTADLEVGDFAAPELATVTLVATVLPVDATDKTLTWSTSKASVATVDSSGVVTAVAEGTATITATANDGSKEKATCVVTVTEPTE